MEPRQVCSSDEDDYDEDGVDDLQGLMNRFHNQASSSQAHSTETPHEAPHEEDAPSMETAEEAAPPPLERDNEEAPPEPAQVLPEVEEVEGVSLPTAREEDPRREVVDLEGPARGGDQGLPPALPRATTMAPGANSKTSFVELPAGHLLRLYFMSKNLFMLVRVLLLLLPGFVITKFQGNDRAAKIARLKALKEQFEQQTTQFSDCNFFPA